MMERDGFETPGLAAHHRMMTPALAAAVAAIARGEMVILVDDEDRENEGDLVVAGAFATPQAINFMARHGRGLICLPLEAAQVDRLALPMMTRHNRTPRQTAFTVSIEARTGIDTGISAFDRARTVAVAIDPAAEPQDIVSPGHVFPLRAAPGGVLARAGHTEGAVDLARLAGLHPSAVICEVMSEDGSMARLPELERLAGTHGLALVTIRDIVAYRQAAARRVTHVATAKLPSAFGEPGDFTVHAFRNPADGIEHLALVHTQDGAAMPGPHALVRVHSECVTGDALGSLRCDCGPQLRTALRRIAQSGSGVLVYLRGHEGRGIGLANKIRAYALQDRGLDTVEANTHLGFAPDGRDYAVAADILAALGVETLELMTNNPAKTEALRRHGLRVSARVPIEMSPNPHNADYLAAKRRKMGHQFDTPRPDTIEEDVS